MKTKNIGRLLVSRLLARSSKQSYSINYAKLHKPAQKAAHRIRKNAHHHHITHKTQKTTHKTAATARHIVYKIQETITSAINSIRKKI